MRSFAKMAQKDGKEERSLNDEGKKEVILCIVIIATLLYILIETITADTIEGKVPIKIVIIQGNFRFCVGSGKYCGKI